MISVTYTTYTGCDDEIPHRTHLTSASAQTNASSDASRHKRPGGSDALLCADAGVRCDISSHRTLGLSISASG